MRLSEAILLGSSVVKPEPGYLLTEWRGENQGCALGMACKAENIAVLHPTDLTPIYAHWPWTLHSWHANRCLCRDIIPFHNAAQLIAHMFDWHVFDDQFRDTPRIQPVWTLEQLVDWVRSVEPAEEEGQTALDGREISVHV
jgi:hypothetical protein